MSSVLAQVPGNNIQQASIILPTTPVMSVSTPPKKSTTLFGTVTSAFRTIKGKRPISELRETVKMILRIFSNQDWAKLSEIQSVAMNAYEESMSSKNVEPLTHIYRNILEIFGSGLTSLLLADSSIPLPRTELELNALANFFKAHQRSVKDLAKPLNVLFKKYPTVKQRSEQNIADATKVETLVSEALNGVDSYYSMKSEQIKAAKTFIRENTKASAKAQRAMTAATRSVTKNLLRNAVPGGKRKTRRLTQRLNK